MNIVELKNFLDIFEDGTKDVNSSGIRDWVDIKFAKEGTDIAETSFISTLDYQSFDIFTGLFEIIFQDKIDYKVLSIVWGLFYG